MKIPFIEKIKNKLNQVINKFDDTATDLNNTLKESAIDISQSLQITTENLVEVSKAFLKTAESLNKTSITIEQALMKSTDNLISATDSMEKSLTKFTTETNNSVKNLEKMFERTVNSIDDFTKGATKDGIKVRIDPTSISLVPKGGRGMISRIAEGVTDFVNPKKQDKI